MKIIKILLMVPTAIIVGGLLILFGAGLLSEPTHRYIMHIVFGADLSKLPRIISVNGQDVEVTNIAGVDYQIPFKYLGFGVSPEHETGMLLNAAWPDMTSFNYQEELKLDPSNKLIIFVVDQKSTTSFEFRLGIDRETYGTLSDVGERYGLHYQIGTKPRMGLLEMYDVSIPRGQLYAEFYTEESAGRVSTYVVCDGDRAVPYPFCKQHFTVDGLLYEVSFGKKHFAEWKDIQAKTVNLIHGFVASNPSSSLAAGDKK